MSIVAQRRRDNDRTAASFFKSQFSFLFLFYSDNEAENIDAIANEQASSAVNDDSLVSRTAATAADDEQSPQTSDVDEPIAHINSQVSRIDAINEKQLNSSDSRRHHLNQRQLTNIDVEHNIPASFIHDANNAANAGR